MVDSLQQNYGSDSPNMTAKVNDDMGAVTLCVRTATGELARTTYVINVDANLNLEVPTLPANRLIDDGWISRDMARRNTRSIIQELKGLFSSKIDGEQEIKTE